MKKDQTLGQLIDEKLPCGQAVSASLSGYNAMFGSVCTSLIPFIFILLKNGTPSHPKGITEEMKGDKDDPRIKWIQASIEEYQIDNGSNLTLIHRFVGLYMTFLEIPSI